MSLNITVNGASRTVNAEPLTPLLHVLREELDVLSPKAGCQNGGCGTCTVLVDGEVVLKDGNPVHLDPAAAMERVAEAQARMLRDSTKHDYLGRDGAIIAPLSLEVH